MNLVPTCYPIVDVIQLMRFISLTKYWKYFWNKSNNTVSGRKISMTVVYILDADFESSTSHSFIVQGQS